MKRIVFCFDGTWNTIEMAYPTNVTRIAQSISREDRDGNSQIIHYDDGVGTGDSKRFTGRLYNRLAGAFGFGLVENVIEAYKFLVLNFDPGDKIYVFGFSRGAFTARSFVGLMRNGGIISRRSIGDIRDVVRLYLSRKGGESPDSDRACQFRYRSCPELLIGADREWRVKNVPGYDHSKGTELSISYLGVWDTVGALGIPNHFGISKFFNRKYEFHDTRLSSFVERARHAVAADEKRRTFEPALWDNIKELNANGQFLYQQLIFPGTHCAVGGGGPVRGLPDAALDWVLRGAREAGLNFDIDDKSPLFSLRPDHRAQLHNAVGKFDWSWKDRLVGMGLRDRQFPNVELADLHATTVRRRQEPPERLPEGARYAPPSLRSLWNDMDEVDVTADVELNSGLVEMKSLWNDKRLRAPDFVKRYLVKPHDTLESISVRVFKVPDYDDIIFLHNQNIGRMYTQDDLFAGSEIEIPIYKELMPR